MAERDEFERRLLALVRSYMDNADERYPDGYEIEDFMVVYQIRVAPTADQELQPWHGGPVPGGWLGVASSSSTGSHWHDEALLAESLKVVRDIRFEEGQDDDDEEEEDENEEQS